MSKEHIHSFLLGVVMVLPLAACVQEETSKLEVNEQNCSRATFRTIEDQEYREKFKDECAVWRSNN